MKKRIGSYEAKTKLPAILEMVSRGESFTITKHGRPIAVLSPAQEEGVESLGDAVQSIKELRKKYNLKGASIKKMIGEGRK
jgi:prevent-host-death family protein